METPKLQDRNLKDPISTLKIAGLENTGTENAGRENAVTYMVFSPCRVKYASWYFLLIFLFNVVDFQH